MSGARFARIPARAASMRDLSGRDFRVLVALAAHADSDGRAYPSMATIARLTGIGRGDIPRSIRRLGQAGLVVRESRVGASALNAYAILFEFEPGQVSAISPSGVSKSADSGNADSSAAVSGIAGQVSAISPSGVSKSAARIDNRPKNRPKNISTARKRAVVRQIKKSADENFNRFWRNYPTRGGQANPRKPALEKFDAAVKRGVDPEMLIRAAANYAECMRRAGTAGRYIKTAEVWLNKASWEQYGDIADDPEPLCAGMI